VFGLPVEGPFDYSVGEELRDRIFEGQRVLVLFNRQRKLGYIVGFLTKSAFKRLNPIIEVLDENPSIDLPILKITKKMSEYYGCSWGEAIETYLPSGLRKKKFFNIAASFALPLAESESRQKHVLLHDTTRHKRWDYIVEQIQITLDKKQGVIFLVPEVSLISYVESTLKKYIKEPVAVIDRKKVSKSEDASWINIKNGFDHVVLGTRSAIFAPVARLGLIIVYDEENESYKQEQAPHYRVHEVAQMRADVEQCHIIYTSCAPSAETWAKIKNSDWELKTLAADNKSEVQIIDMTNYNPQRSSIMSFPLQNNIQKVLSDGGKVILFMNRRGFSTVTKCNQCGHAMKCERCETNLTYLFSKKILACRHCNVEKEIPKVCPACHGSYMRSLGMGIEKLESEAARVYPYVFVNRFDKDTKQYPSKASIVIATQALMKVHESIQADLIAVLDFDAELNHFDFRSSQQAFSLLVRLYQMSTKKLIVQTKMADHYCIKAASKMNFQTFYREELKLRKEIGFPPYKHLVSVGIRGKKEEAVLDYSQKLYNKLQKHLPKALDIMEPHPDGVPKMRDQYRYSIMCKGKSVNKIVSFVKKQLKDTRKNAGIIVTLNVDPY